MRGKQTCSLNNKLTDEFKLTMQTKLPTKATDIFLVHLFLFLVFFEFAGVSLHAGQGPGLTSRGAFSGTAATHPGCAPAPTVERAAGMLRAALGDDG